MKCYFISLNSDRLERFKNQFGFLKDATWISGSDKFESEIHHLAGPCLFIFDFFGDREVLDEMVLKIRDQKTQSKIIYLMDNLIGRDLEAHQSTPAGADAYISSEINVKDFQEMIFGFDSSAPKTKLQNIDDLKSGVRMSDKDQELSLDDLGELEIYEEKKAENEQVESSDDLDLNLDELDLELSTEDEPAESVENLGELDLDLSSPPPTEQTSSGLNLNLQSSDELDLSLSDDTSAESEEINEKPVLETDFKDEDLSQHAVESLKEIDSLMQFDGSQVNINNNFPLKHDLDEPLVSDDLDLANLDFSNQEQDDSSEVIKEDEKPKRKKKEKDLGQDLKEISGAYSGEMERTQATIANLRADREELLKKIQDLEDKSVMHNRQVLTLRAELDEKKIELSIIRKKLNEEISELKDKLSIYDEKKLILEEKNRFLQQELDKAGQKNKIDVKKVMMRERELEQKLELLKTDAEIQIRNRDLKILELKRKIDAMEFDMESISNQEKRSVESRYELEDKLDKAIKTLRNAINVLEEESDKSHAIETLKKNIDM
ncbi:MAG: hypothetical protein AB7I27_03030 [Bacteriovoracaceae bacterium]